MVTAATAAETPGGKENRLAKSNSPYLLLHAKNPVDWYPWGPEALERAKAENKPIFLSIGYSSCFWCHVMERLVFENETIAAYMNEHFVNIKVDREERPDLDEIYMLSLQVYFSAIRSGQGAGWPLSMFLTPDGRPFAGGTYFPPEDKNGQAGFGKVLKQVHDVWEKHPDQIRNTADLVTKEVQRLSKPQLNLEAAAVSGELVEAGLRDILAAYDKEHGGLDYSGADPEASKFPVPTRLEFLQSMSQSANANPEILAALDHTLERIAAGGIHDHLGGGFHRYSTDREWRVPHFEKMLYDNALLVDVYVVAYQRTSRRTYRQVVESTLDFILRDMTDPAGGFYSALDAETDGVEGRYYVWSRDEVNQILGADDGRLFIAAYGMDEPQSFEPGAVLFLPRTLADTADHLQMPVQDLEDRLAASRKKLLEARQKRSPLLRDDKVLVGWNGLMVRALARAGKTLRRKDYLDAAEKGAQFVLTQMKDKNGRLLHSWRGGQANLAAYVDDYAGLTAGLIALHDATGEARWLESAERLTEEQQRLFWDNDGKGFFLTASDQEQLLARPKNAFDSVVPSGNSLSVRNLVRLRQLTGDVRYARTADETVRAFAGVIQTGPSGYSTLLLGLHELLATAGAQPMTSGPVAGLFSAPPMTFADPDDPQTPASAPPSTPMPQTLAAAPKTAVPPKTEGAPQAAEADAPPAPFAAATAENAGKHPLLAAKGYLAADGLVAGRANPVAVVLDVKEEWHINANPPRPKQMKATELTGKFTAESALKGVVYPKGHDFVLEGFDEPLSVYEGQVVLIGTIDVPASAAGKEESVTLSIRYQACNNETCQRPTTLEIAGKVKVLPAGSQPKFINRRLFEPAGDK